MDSNNRRYPLRIEGLRKNVTKSDVINSFGCTTTDVLEPVEIFSHGPTTTAYVVLNRPDAAYEFLIASEPVKDGSRVNLIPELFDEMSITLNGCWLKEIEDENPAIQAEIQQLADQFNLKLAHIKESVHGDRETISLTGVPCRIEQARAHWHDKMQATIMSRSRNLKRKLSETHFRPGVVGNRYSGNGKSVQSGKYEDDMQSRNEQRNPALKFEDPQSFVDHKSSAENKGSSDYTNPTKKRERALKASDMKVEISGGAASIFTDDVKTDQMKVGQGKRNRVLISKTGDMQKSGSPVDASGMSSPFGYQSSTQYERKIRVGMDIHRYLVEHSTRLNFTDSSISQHQISEKEIDWIFGGNNEKDLRRNEEELKRLIDKLLIKCYTAPTEFDFAIFQTLIEAENKNEDVTLIFDPKARSCKVVGPQNDVERTYKWISDISGDLAKGKQKPGRGSASDASDSGSISQHFATQQSGYQRHIQGYGSHISDIGNSQGRLLDPKMTKAGDGIRISKRSSKDRLELETRGDLRVSVYQGNMIKQATEVIVNPANDCLGHGGGLARVILDAAGQVIDDESRQIIFKRGKLKTSDVVHTSAGKLPQPIKYVVHAVGPTAHEFKDNKAGLVPMLKATFRNCLDYANDKLGVSSISLPPISSGIFAVPIPDIIQGAVEAIQDFDRKNSSSRSVLREVHFISNDAKTTEEMIACFRNVIG